jgi:predicted transcriptional regulator YdeE
MHKRTIQSFNIIGISVRTTNARGKSAIDIPALWDKFISGQVAEKIPGKIDNTVYCVYTEYEKDHTRPYTVILGCQVPNLDNIPEGLTGKTIETGDYYRHKAKGDISQGVVFYAWTAIWNSDIPRAFTSDFEVYGEKAQDTEVDIFVAVNTDDADAELLEESISLRPVF